ncbi:unnamed protein product [Bursaphelenchus xylophilus]|uniref:Major sperm protein n=1 Tax=Bursaphelenchus xylophilus TaxID=6326 RepID=A0A1I7RXQ4_BURXY|nr:unnamed protein product [Bursaphelenchus xylophilus]CAG9126653.1 unnamed protein product [Bursaphelenchus xylophilus]
MLNENSLLSEATLQAYQFYLHFALLASLLSTCFTVFVVQKAQIQKMSTYRIYIIQEVIWSFLYELSMGLYAPVSYFPYVCTHSASFMDRFPHGLQLSIMFVLPLFGVGKGVSLFALNIRRLLEAYPPNPVVDFFKFRGCTTLVMENGVFILLYFLFMGPLMLQLEPPYIANAILNQTSPVLSKVLERHPNMICVSSTAIPALFAIPLCLFVGSIFFMLFLQLSMYKLLRPMETKVSSQTYRLQIMLFKSLFFQVIVASVFLLLPAAIWTSGGLFEFEQAPFLSIFGSSIILTHSTMDCASILITVRPYRAMLNRSILRIFKKDVSLKISSSTKVLYISRRSSAHNGGTISAEAQRAGVSAEQSFRRKRESHISQKNHPMCDVLPGFPGILPNKPDEPEFKLCTDLNGPIVFNCTMLDFGPVSVNIRLDNPTNQIHTFKCKCTSYDYLRVKPPLGFIEPYSTINLKVVFRSKNIPEDTQVVAIYHMPVDDTTIPLRDLWPHAATFDGVRRFRCEFVNEFDLR